MSYRAQLQAMMDAVVVGGDAGFVKPRGAFPPEAQLEVYRDGYGARLLAVLEGAYPALLRYLGKGAFHATATGYVKAVPSRHYNIERYAVGFSDYLKGCVEDGAVQELAALEGAMAEVYLAEESPPLGRDWIKRQSPGSLAAAQLRLRTASRLLECRYRVNAYVDACRAGDAPDAIEPGGQWLLVLRHRNRLHRHVLEEGEYRLLASLANGGTLARAAEEETAQGDAASVTRWFARWAGEGFLRQPEGDDNAG